MSDKILDLGWVFDRRDSPTYGVNPEGFRAKRNIHPAKKGNVFIADFILRMG